MGKQAAISLSTSILAAMVFVGLFVMLLVRAGASGYLLKDVSSDKMLEAIKAVAQGHQPGDC